jgi:hypothetical protein
MVNESLEGRPKTVAKTTAIVFARSLGHSLITRTERPVGFRKSCSPGQLSTWKRSISALASARR